MFSMSMTPGGIFQFGEFQIDARARSLRRQEAMVTLNFRSFDVLLYFVQNPGRVLTREELVKNVWADAFVDESSLAQSISVLRRALDEKPGDNSYIVTLPGRGYQFVAPVQVVTPEVTTPEMNAPEIMARDNGNTVPEVATPAINSSSGLIFQQHTVRTSVVTTNQEQLSAPISRSRFARMASPLAIAATFAVSVASIGGAWYWHSHQAPKLTEKDTIVVADFDNRTGDPVFDDTLKQALAVDLDQSPYLNVVPDQKISEGLKLMGRDPGQRVTGGVARELCQRVSSNAVLQGSIANLGSQYVLVLTATNCATGNSLASEQVRAESKEKIFPALDKAASDLRRRLGESSGSIEKYDTPVEQATTPSLAALQAYSAGVKAWENKGNEAAIPFFTRAIELDPKFAMAYARLGNSYANLGVPGANENLEKAFRLRDQVSERERFYIDSRYYNTVTGEEEKAIRVLEQWRQVYPREAGPARTLVIMYRIFGQYEDALREAKESVLLEPTDNNYFDLVFTALMLNRLDEAQAILKQWQARIPDSTQQVFDLYYLAFLRRDSAGMEKELAEGVSADYESGLLGSHADTEAYYGRIRKSREFSRRAMESAVAVVGDKQNAGLRAAFVEVDGSLREAVLGYSGQAQRDVTASLNLSNGDRVKVDGALALALAGDARRAETITADLEKRYPFATRDTIDNNYWFPIIWAAIELSRNNPAKAIQDLEVTSPYELGSVFGEYTAPLFPVYLRGQAFLVLHQGREAAAEFQKFVDHPGIVMNYPLGAVAYVGLARADAMQGDTVKARAAYQDFFSLWKDADPDVPILRQAKTEYAKLQ
jgi:eukaryotic-like serine/threonine-protein kinase